MSAYVIERGVDKNTSLRVSRTLLDLVWRVPSFEQGAAPDDLVEICVVPLAGDRLIRACRLLINEEVVSGTYPQNSVYNDDETFFEYFGSHLAFALCPVEQKDMLIGAFYIKPNFPGRSGHICNGGFLVDHRFRGRGMGKLLAEAFLQLAPVAGFKAAFFNLVYFDNPASKALWGSFGFKVAGVVPAAKYDRDDQPVDAYMMYRAFE